MARIFYEEHHDTYNIWSNEDLRINIIKNTYLKENGLRLQILVNYSTLDNEVNTIRRTNVST